MTAATTERPPAQLRGVEHHCPTGFHTEPSANCYAGARHGCRCRICCALQTARRHRDRTPKPLTRPVHRYTHMVRDLLAAGWKVGEIATEADVSKRTVRYVRDAAHPRVQLPVAEAIVALWERTPLPDPDDGMSARREDEAWLRAMGESDDLIATRLGVTVGALLRMRDRDKAEAS